MTYESGKGIGVSFLGESSVENSPGICYYEMEPRLF